MSQKSRERDPFGRKGSISNTIAEARASVSEYSLRPTTPGRGLGGFSMAEPSRPYTPSDSLNSRYDHVSGLGMPPPTPNPYGSSGSGSMAPLVPASLLNPSRPFTAASNRRGDSVFSNSGSDEPQYGSGAQYSSNRVGFNSSSSGSGLLNALAPKSSAPLTGSLMGRRPNSSAGGILVGNPSGSPHLSALPGPARAAAPSGTHSPPYSSGANSTSVVARPSTSMSMSSRAAAPAPAPAAAPVPRAQAADTSFMAAPSSSSVPTAASRRPQSADVSRRRSYAMEISALLAAANSLATTWLAQKTEADERGDDTSDPMPHEQDTSKVVKLYTRAGDLLDAVNNPSELVKICRLVLLLPYEQSCQKIFSRACNRLFDFSRKPSNDVYFHQEALFDPLLMVLQHAHVYSFEEVSYVLGTIRNLAVDPTSQLMLCKHGGVTALGNLLKEDVYEALISDAETREKVLIEITGVLRNLSVVKKFQKDFSGPVLDALNALLFRYTMNGTLMLNVARILSKLSLHQFCRAALSSYAPNIEMLLQLLALHDTNLALAVRVCFILGNLTVSNEENRRRIGLDFSGASIALSVLDLAVYRDERLGNKIRSLTAATAAHAEKAKGDKKPASVRGMGSIAEDDEEVEDARERRRRDREDQLEVIEDGDESDESDEGGKKRNGVDEDEVPNVDDDEDDEEDDMDEDVFGSLSASEAHRRRLQKLAQVEAQFKENEDLLVKLIRLIGNLGIHAGVGAVLSRHASIALMVDLLARKAPKVDTTEELVLNCVATVTNLSFYHHPNNVLFGNKQSILRYLLPLLFSSNQEMVMESVRALGNFSRDADFRDDMLTTRADEAMVVLLDHSELQVVFAVCGVLVNLSSDPRHRTSLMQLDALGKLLDVLDRGSSELPDASALSVITVVVKIFINLCLDAPPRRNSAASAANEEEELLDGGDEDGDDADQGGVVAVTPEWLSNSMHQQLFLQLQDVLGQLPADLESLSEFVGKDGRGPEWEGLLREVVSVCTSLLDLIGEPESLEDYQGGTSGDALPPIDHEDDGEESDDGEEQDDEDEEDDEEDGDEDEEVEADEADYDVLVADPAAPNGGRRSLGAFDEEDEHLFGDHGDDLPSARPPMHAEEPSDDD